MEKIYLKNINVPTSWEEVTLKQFTEYLQKLEELKKENEDELDKSKLVFESITSFSNLTKEDLAQYPIDVVERIIEKMDFLTKPLPDYEAKNKITVNDEEYQINFFEKLKLQEYLDANQVLEKDKYNYALLLTILCRKNGEVYNDDFIANTLEDRQKMFEGLPVSKVMPLVNFFLNYLKIYKTCTLLSMLADHEKAEIINYVENTLVSLEKEAFSLRYSPLLIIRLKRLLRLAKNI
jgi:hypothetical protein